MAKKGIFFFVLRFTVTAASIFSSWGTKTSLLMAALALMAACELANYWKRDQAHWSLRRREGQKSFKINKTRTNSTFWKKRQKIYIRASLFPWFNGLRRLNLYHFSVFLPFGADFAARNSGEVKKKDAKHVGVLFKSLWMRRHQFLVSRETIFNRISLPPRPSHRLLPPCSQLSYRCGWSSHEGAP